MESYDVIIVGAGPAGLRCAEVLGGSRLEVLVTEKKSVIGPKVCAGGLTFLNGHFELPAADVLTFPIQRIELNGEEHVLTLKNPLRVIDRPRLGDHLLERVQRYPNIHISAGTPIVEIGENWAASENAKIGFRYLVGADGSGSIVRKYLGKSNKMYAGIHYVIPGTRSEPLWFFNPQVLGSGYGWILPHRTFVSAGVFFNPKLISSENAREVLHGLLDKHGIDRRKARFEAAPVNCLYRGTRFGNIFLVGDAAGLPSAATGEGISYALVSGEDVALYLLGGKSGFRGIKEIIRYKKRQERILAIFDAFPSLQPIFFSLFVSLIKRPWFQTFFGN